MINNLMHELSQFLGIEVILANQDVPQMSFPFGTYKITESKMDKPHTRIRKQNGAANDNVDVSYLYRRSLTVQLSFFNRGESGDLQNQIMQYAEKAWIWINEQGRDICILSEAVPKIVSEKITAEVKVVENRNEYRASFDFAINNMVENVTTVEAITGVDYILETKN